MTHHPWCMTYCVGIDNRALLPPFIPIGYGEDGTFGQMVALCDQSAFFGHLAYGIVHESDRQASYGSSGPRSAMRIRLRDVLAVLLSRCGVPASARRSSDRMRVLASHLISVGGLRPSDFVELIRSTVLEMRCRTIASLESRGEDEPCAAHWQAEVQMYRDCFLRRVACPDFFVPIEFSAEPVLDDAFRDLQTVVTRFGQLLDEWPEIVSAAARVSPGAGVPV